MKKQGTAGIGGGAISHHENITIKITFGTNGQTITTEFPVYASFCASMDALGIGLLGQVGFFEKYPTTFNHTQKVFAIEIP